MRKWRLTGQRISGVVHPDKQLDGELKRAFVVFETKYEANIAVGALEDDVGLSVGSEGLASEQGCFGASYFFDLLKMYT